MPTTVPDGDPAQHHEHRHLGSVIVVGWSAPAERRHADRAGGSPRAPDRGMRFDGRVHARRNEEATMPGPSTVTSMSASPLRPDEIEVSGSSHPGRVRPDNQDHFLIGSMSSDARVYNTSLPPSVFTEPHEWTSFVGVVADGVGGQAGGAEASRAAIESVMGYVDVAVDAYYAFHRADEAEFCNALAAAATRAHEEVLARAERNPALAGMATTLTLVVAVWPVMYLLHVGDSRAYRLRDGRLEQLTRDQTLAQDLIDEGTLPADALPHTPLARILSSAVGHSTRPVVTPFSTAPGDVWLLCTDGLTKHVPDDRIAARLREMTSTDQVCQDLVQDALDGGGTDNITVVVGRRHPHPTTD
jgi:protein phosphatase